MAFVQKIPDLGLAADALAGVIKFEMSANTSDSQRSTRGH